jgi:type IV pilus assembly protein PilF
MTSVRVRGCVLWLAMCAWAVACVHTPSEAERGRARGHYDAAIALVGEAETASGKGDQPTRDLKYRAALKELFDSEAIYADDPEVEYLHATIAFLGFNQTDEALVRLQRAVVLRAGQAPTTASAPEREYPEAEQLMGVIRMSQGKPAEAVPHFERARMNMLYTTPYFAEQELGYALFQLGRHDDALKHLHTAVQLQPRLCGAYTRIAEVEEARFQPARVDAALTTFFKVCDCDDQRVASRMLAPAYFMAGMARLKMGDQPRAAEALDVCVKRFASEPVAAQCQQALQPIADFLPLPPVVE